MFLDLDLEQDNHYVTELLRGLGANDSETSVNIICRAFFLIIQIFERLACELNICQNSGERTKKNLHRDLMTVVEELVREDVFTKKTDRAPLKIMMSPRLFTTLRYQFFNESMTTRKVLVKVEDQDKIHMKQNERSDILFTYYFKTKALFWALQ